MAFIGKFPWCRKILSISQVFDGGPEVAIFDAEIVVDDETSWKSWILVGDVPPTFIPHEEFDGLAPALENQILNFEAWADAVDRRETDMSKYTPVMF